MINLGSPYLTELGTNSPKLGALVVANYPTSIGGSFHSIDSPNAFNLAAFRSPGFLGSHGFGFAAASNFAGFRDPNQNGFETNQGEANSLNLSQGFRHTNNNSPVNLYLGNSNSPTHNRGDSVESFCYQDNNNRLNKDFDNNYNLTNNNNNTIHNKKDDLNSLSRENSPRNHYNSDSPDLLNNKRADTCSPVDSSRSYSSQRNEEIGYHSPSHNNDSLGSQSPENLSSPVKNSNNNHLSTNHNNNLHNSNNSAHHNKSNSISEMLDHKLQLSFLGPPLAALHSMTEMKSQNSPQTSQNHTPGLSNPHGIDSILSRPTPVTSAQLNALTGGE